MGKRFTAVLVLVAILMFIIGFAAGHDAHYMWDSHIYTRAAYVTEVRKSQELVVCEDAVGFMWTFYGVEDYEVGDLVILSMNDNKTQDSILDDRVEGAVYAGFWRE